MSGEQPVLRVVRGRPTAEELAIVVAVMSVAASPAPAATAPAGMSLWASKARQIRPPMRPGPAAWRASTLPR